MDGSRGDACIIRRRWEPINGSVFCHSKPRTWRRTRSKRTGLVPTSSAVPAATENKQHNDDDDQKRRCIHIALLKADASVSEPIVV